MKSESTRIFVYGTLKPGERNYSVYCQGQVLSQMPAYTWGDLYALPVGYPAMTEGTNKVRGVLLSFNDPQILSSLDRLEDYKEDRAADLNEYERLWVPTYDSSDRLITYAWAYYMTTARISQHQGLKLASGIWHGITLD